MNSHRLGCFGLVPVVSFQDHQNEPLLELLEGFFIQQPAVNHLSDQGFQLILHSQLPFESKTQPVSRRFEVDPHWSDHSGQVKKAEPRWHIHPWSQHRMLDSLALPELLDSIVSIQKFRFEGGWCDSD
jgi:hypothetical protein